MVLGLTSVALGFQVLHAALNLMLSLLEGAVKELAQKIIDDYTKATSQLLQVTEGLDAKPNSAPSGGQQLMLNYFGTLSGSEFDVAYLEQQIVAHEEAVGLFTIASSLVQDAELKAFATNTLPVLQSHLEMAREDVQAAHN